LLADVSASEPAPNVRTSPCAIVSFVLGIASLVTLWATALPAIIVGIVALWIIGKSAGRLKGNGLAVAGVAIPAVSLSAIALLLAGTVGYSNWSPGRRDGLAGVNLRATTWVKCRNPACATEYEMNLKEYLQQIEDSIDPMACITPPLPCKECGELAVYRATKCPKCNLVFELGAVPDDFYDRCPECGYSKTENERADAARGRL